MDAASVTALVDDRLRGVRARAGARLHGAFDGLMDRHGWLRGDDPDYYLGLNSQPVLVLPLWLADAHPVDDAVLAEVLAASWLGYAAVRVQDDWMDEGLGEPAEVVWLGQAFLVAHQAALAKVVGDHPGFWALFEDVWAGYGDAMLLEAELLAPEATYGPDEEAAVLRRSRPLVLPGAALLARAGAWEGIADLEALVAHAVRAAQTFNDALDARTDLRQGRFTPVVRRFGGAQGEGELMRQLIVEGGLDALFAESQADLQAARAAADRLGATAAAAWLDARGDMMLAALQAALQEFFARLLNHANTPGGDPGSPAPAPPMGRTTT
jgi:hypothetical protein